MNTTEPQFIATEYKIYNIGIVAFLLLCFRIPQAYKENVNYFSLPPQSLTGFHVRSSLHWSAQLKLMQKAENPVSSLEQRYMKHAFQKTHFLFYCMYSVRICIQDRIIFYTSGCIWSIFKVIMHYYGIGNGSFLPQLSGILVCNNTVWLNY